MRKKNIHGERTWNIFQHTHAELCEVKVEENNEAMICEIKVG